MLNKTDYKEVTVCRYTIIGFDMLEFMCSRIFICIVQISSLATTCIGQPSLIFSSHSEKNWMFALMVAALSKENLLFYMYDLLAHWLSLAQL